MANDSTVVPASSAELETIVAMTRRTRRQLAQWAPTYFNPATGADEMHAGFLGFLVDSEDHSTKVVCAPSGAVIGFFVEIEQDGHLWVDDLSALGSEELPLVVHAVARALDTPWVTCIAALDAKRRAALTSIGAEVISTYWARSLEELPTNLPPSVPNSSEAIDVAPGLAARHTFGGRPFAADAPGALIVSTEDGGAVGSASVSPPIYDPGGPTTVVDRITGTDRAAIVRQAMDAAAQRGDAQLVIVSASEDKELAEVARQCGFEPVVELVGIETITAAQSG